MGFLVRGLGMRSWLSVFGLAAMPSNPDAANAFSTPVRVALIIIYFGVCLFLSISACIHPCSLRLKFILVYFVVICGVHSVRLRN